MSPTAVICLCICAVIVGINIGFIAALLASKYWHVENANREAIERRAAAAESRDHG
jgi:hypothetical protein